MRCHNAAMSDNSSNSDLERSKVTDRWQIVWSGFSWAMIGFGIGAILAVPFIIIFAIDGRDVMVGGMASGGILGAFLGCRYGVRRARCP